MIYKNGLRTPEKLRSKRMAEPLRTEEIDSRLKKSACMVDGGGMPEATPEDWARQNKMRQEWLDAHPDAEYEGWMSI